MRRMVHPLSTESASNLLHSNTVSRNGNDEDGMEVYIISTVTVFHSFSCVRTVHPRLGHILFTCT